MDTSTCSINAYAGLRKECSFKFPVVDSDELEVFLRGSDRLLTLLVDAGSFRLSLEQGSDAMRRMTALHASQQTESAQAMPVNKIRVVYWSQP